MGQTHRFVKQIRSVVVQRCTGNLLHHLPHKVIIQVAVHALATIIHIAGIDLSPDAKKYYHGYKGCVAGTAVGTVLYLYPGLAVACACASRTPSDRNLNMPNLELAKNPVYYNAYKKEAYRKKKKKTWKAFNTTLAIETAVFVVLIVSIFAGV
jgi:hypothetical protein